MFDPRTRLRFNALSELYRCASYIDAVLCMLIILSALQVLAIFRTTRWMLKVLSLAMT